ncbi:MAG: Holliday junction resolvase RuvX [Catenisphaera adipataccumulans]|jgi:putative Holliday junction resolvase|uniref:Holliday junction resolvase RuvX n=1 Tax=Catenisphaera adipataccumulans TaxID=700500 RepID=UPI003D8C16CE
MSRIIGLDLGSKTCGVAISDRSQLIARALKTIRFESDDYDDCFDQVLALLDEQDVHEVVLGLPKHMNGDIGIRGEISVQFAEELEKEGVKATLWDERLTTVAAEKILLEGDVSRRKRKKIIDQMAAVQILQNYLDRKRNGSLPE